MEDINKPIDVTKIETIKELESLAWRFSQQRDLWQTNLNIVKNEIDKRNKIEEAEIKE